ncbi:type IV toxin-antitoxin system AbiEi family antitoxin domain-containing protein [Enemella evansiae]|uniref:type IV toxin-antitoxin system AbiEi family antitoxin domain-containing protein n=1 Tax=Enemella evansiae TaxID=2016499 RepID=UPI00118147AF|nr:hypothetical protein [Enemella evansiae]
MDVTGCLELWGGVGRWSALVRATSRRELAEAVSAGAVVRDSRGRYALPTAGEALRRAHAMSAVLSHQSAAAHWGWEQKDTPATITVTVPRSRRLRTIPKDVSVHWADLAPDDVDRAGVTSRSRTLVDCLRTLPFDAGLAIADSALRNGDCAEFTLQRLAKAVRGRGAGTVRRVASCATALAANPFESVLRALCLDAGLDVEPQVAIYREDGPQREFLGRPDLVDRGRRLIFEADSYEYHGGQQEFRRDCRRYNGFQLVPFRCFRMPWLDTIREQHRVTDVLVQLVNPAPVPLTFLVAA